MARFTCAAVVAAALVVTVVASVGAQSAFPERDGVVANGTDMALSAARINNDFRERIGDPYALKGLVLVVDDCRPDPEVYLDQALVHYDLAPRAGALANDTVAWLVCLDPRYTGFFYAAENPYANVLDEGAATDVMVEDLRASNFTGAFTGSIDVVAGQLAASSWAPEPTGEVVQSAPPVGLPDTAASGQSNGAASGSGATGGGRGAASWLAPLVALGAAGAGVWLWRRRSPQAKEVQGRAVPEPVRLMDEKLADLEKRLTPENNAQARLVLAYESLGDEAMLAINQRHEAMLARFKALQDGAATLRARATAGPVDPPALAEQYRAPLAEADALIAYVNGLATEADHVEMWDERAPVLAVDARKSIDAARARYTADAAGLQLPAVDMALAFPTALVDAAERALTAGQRIPAGRQAEDAGTIADRTGALPGTLRTVDAAVDEASGLFARFETFAESSWADIRGNGSEAEESLDTAVAMFGRIVGAEHGAFGADAGAGYLASLDQVDAEVERARGLVTAITERLTFLQRAREQAATAIDGVQKDIDDARAWIARPEVDPDVSAAPVTALEAAEATLKEVRLAVGAPKPDWVAVLRLVNAADRATDDALASARAEQERVAARRRQLESTRTDAEAAVDRVERFLGAHRADAGAASVEGVNAARATLERAGEAERAAEAVQDVARADALATAATAYQRAREQADAAYNALASEVARADEKRQSEVRRRDWMGPIVPTPMGPFSRGGMWGGGFGGGLGGSISPPSRPSSWGSRPSGGGGSIGSSGGGSSSRRGGGRGW
jgi:hypothetical protein